MRKARRFHGFLPDTIAKIYCCGNILTERSRAGSDTHGPIVAEKRPTSEVPSLLQNRLMSQSVGPTAEVGRILRVLHSTALRARSPASVSNETTSCVRRS